MKKYEKTTSNILKTVVLIGKTGSGKTSTANLLFGLNWKIDNAVACTKTLQSATHLLEHPYSRVRTNVRLIDTPGVGEDEKKDEDYLILYKKALAEATHLFWLVQADTRALRNDQIVLERLSPFLGESVCFTIVLNQIDRIGLGDWDFSLNMPSEHQKLQIKEKAAWVKKRLAKIIPHIPVSIVSLSAVHQFGKHALIQHILEANKKTGE